MMPEPMKSLRVSSGMNLNCSQFSARASSTGISSVARRTISAAATLTGLLLFASAALEVVI
jgi:hypothetical protein